MSDIIKMTLKLLAITLVAGLLLAATYVITKDPIAEQDAKTATAARQEVIDASTFDQLNIDSAASEYPTVNEAFIAKDSSGKTVGATINLTVKGFKPGIDLTVGISSDGKITGVHVGSNEETPGLGARATEESFYGQYAGKSTDKALEVVKNTASSDNQIVAIAGATITSKGVTSGVNTAIEFFKNFVAPNIAG